jgi:hypothetical protein
MLVNYYWYIIIPFFLTILFVFNNITMFIIFYWNIITFLI